jgi:DtxR family Mn-dependent transcriptional regulator
MVEDIEFLRAIYILGRGDRRARIKTTAIARTLGVSPSTATTRLKKMALKGLVVYEPRKGVSLSPKGLVLLTRTVWKEALLEILLVRAGVPLDKACKAAKYMALGFSDDAAKILCDILGHPRYCPHGLRIPHPELGEIVEGDIRYCGLAIDI